MARAASTPGAARWRTAVARRSRSAAAARRRARPPPPRPPAGAQWAWPWVVARDAARRPGRLAEPVRADGRVMVLWGDGTKAVVDAAGLAFHHAGGEDSYEGGYKTLSAAQQETCASPLQAHATLYSVVARRNAARDSCGPRADARCRG